MEENEYTMGESIYIFRNGTLSRKDDNILMTDLNGEKKNLRIEVLDEIYLFGEVTLNTKLLNIASQNNVVIHVFNYYGFYSGSFFPRERKISGNIIVEQVRNYDDLIKRLKLAKEFVCTAAANIYRNLRYYNGRGIDLKRDMIEIESLQNKISKSTGISELMGIEGNIRKIYYACWNKIINQDINFNKRTKRPPDNMINSIISFINSLIYSTVLSEIYKTHLHPAISFLHEPGERRFSLALDIAEVFKPLIGDRMIFSMLNKNQLNENDFEYDSNFTYIKESSRRKIMEEYDKRLERVIMHRDLGREVSYRYLIRLECYKIIKHIIGEKDYNGFVIWW